MPILRNTRTGVVVQCDERTAAALGPGWQPADEAAKPAKSAPKKSSK